MRKFLREEDGDDSGSEFNGVRSSVNGFDGMVKTSFFMADKKHFF